MSQATDHTADDAARGPAHHWLLPALMGLFFLSGACGLIYQVLWLRLLGLVFGVTVHAAATTLASFMTGLALGSFLSGRIADRVRRPLLWFGGIEALVGLTALATPLLLGLVQRLYVALHPLVPHALLPLTVLRLGLAFAVLVVPTTLMGATLPIVIKSSLGRSARLGPRIGLLYAVNTTGAIGGALLAGFRLIGGVGLAGSFRLAASLNLAVGLLSVLAAWRVGARRDGLSPAHDGGGRAGDAASAQLASAAREPGGEALSSGARRIVMAVFAVSGCASLALEVVWFRALTLAVPATAYAFTIMLATMLLGIAAGSWLAAPWLALRRRGASWLAVLALLELAIGIAAALSLRGLARAWDVVAWIQHPPPGEPLMQGLLLFVASGVAILPAALLLGFAFPIGLHVVAGGGDGGDGGDGDQVGRRVGGLYGINVLGGIAGSLVAGFVLLPKLGSQHSVLIIGGLQVAGGLLLLALLARRRPATSLLCGVIGVSAFVGAARADGDPLTTVIANRYPEDELLWCEEGVQATVSVMRAPRGARLLFLDGLPQGSTLPGTVNYHRLIGHLPVLLHPAPRQALVIGLGGGATAGAVAMHPGLQVDLVELSQSVVDGAALFKDINGDVLARPNVHLIVDDARSVLAFAPERYDVITADIIQPSHAGAGNLYSADYYRLARAALSPDGVMLQWVGPREEIRYKLILRTFLSVFPDATLWADGTLLVGALHPLRLDPLAFEAAVQDGELRAALAHVFLDDFGRLLERYTAGPEEIAAYVDEGPLLTDDRPMLEYYISLPADTTLVDPDCLHGEALRLLGR